MTKGPNGEHRLCASCGAWHLPHCPDNCTNVPICEACWKKCPISTRVFAISCARVSARVEALDNTIFQGIEGAIVDLVQQKASRMGEYGNN